MTMAQITPQNEAGAVFALIIGIDDYLATEHFPPLRGAVNDARAFEQYLLDSHDRRGLNVPLPNILLIENRQATRENILSAFKSHLLENRNIPDRGDTAMIFFYAGHGTRTEAPGNLIAPDSKVEAISPVDEGTIDAEGNYVHPIPDNVLGWLLWELAAKKGSNITVIFDSCHSGGMGRDTGTPRARTSLSPPIPPDLDSHLWTGGTEIAICYRIWSPSTATHVLLAACREDETAQEVVLKDNSCRGRFTERLITLLRRLPLEHTTYADLVASLPIWSGQNPHCGGARRNHLVFNANHLWPGQKFLPLLPDASSDPSGLQTYSVDIGSVEGIVPGAEFTAFSGAKKPLCVLVAHSARVNRTILIKKGTERIDIPEGARVQISDWMNGGMILRVYITPNFPYEKELFTSTLASSQQRKHTFIRAPSVEEADILLRTEADEVVLEHLGGIMGESRFQRRFSLGEKGAHLPILVDGIAHFKYFLERHYSGVPFADFQLKMHRLRGEYPAREPDLGFGDGGNLIRNMQARFVPDKDACYGFTIRNTSNIDLFPYLFYFDPQKYTIQLWYAPPGKKIPPPLKSRGGELTIGMGGERAFKFWIPSGEKSSCGILKLFVSAKYLDLDWIQQTTSPLDSSFEGTGRLLAEHEPFDIGVEETWDALNVFLSLTADEDLAREVEATLKVSKSANSSGSTPEGSWKAH
ncbi:caspase domain-containing protein [Mycena pura]|uniref:Caspase domain-containing protein n=1 Tax=Mycena pura TaxID=153505 RepID=A0AAD6XZ54_9AGAR|nr:caspase domain-containing protein [Mycena pura]